MLKEDILIGAEESGGIGVKGHIPERDGILNSCSSWKRSLRRARRRRKCCARFIRSLASFIFVDETCTLPISVGQELVEELGTDAAREPRRLRCFGS